MATITAISTDLFSFRSGVFTSEYTDLCGLGADVFQRLYPNRRDVGFALRNPATGNVVMFRMSRSVIIHDETVGWEFSVMADEARKNPALVDLKAIVYND